MARERTFEPQQEGPPLWVSMCSEHRKATTGCSQCKVGYWTNEYELEKQRAEFRKDPDAWRKKMMK